MPSLGSINTILIWLRIECSYRTCVRRAWIFQRICPKVEGSGSSSSAPNDGEEDDNNDSRHVTDVLLWEDGGLHSFKLHKFSVCWRKDRNLHDSHSPPFLWWQSLSSEFFSTSSKPTCFTFSPFLMMATICRLGVKKISICIVYSPLIL